MNHHQYFMQRCFQLAVQGGANTKTNPMVGAVITHNGQIIGEGYHQQYGQAHAEINAINSVAPENKYKLPESCIYVSLEPCAHHGKTPPCATAIVQHKIPEVYIAQLDPFPKVSGRGLDILQQAGVKVHTQLLNKTGQWLNRRFLTFVQKKRPYIILKWAETKNGYFAPINKQQQWISNKLSKYLVHKWRGEESAIMVGTKTALIDNPRLNNRLWYGTSPIRVVLDKHLRIPPHHHLLNDDLQTIVFTQNHPTPTFLNKDVQYINIHFDENILTNVLAYLYRANVKSLIVEGGKQLLSSFITAGVWDEARVLQGHQKWSEGTTAPQLHKAKQVCSHKIGNNILKVLLSN